MAATAFPISFLFMSFLMGGGFGLPVSLPPAPPHEMMYRLAPEQCLYFSCMSGAKTPDGASANQTEALFAEPEVQQLVKELEAQGLAALRKMGQEDPQAAIAAEVIPTVVRVLLTRPICFYVGDVTPVGPAGVPSGTAGAAIKLGPYKADVEKLLQMAPPQALQEVTIANETFHQVQTPPQAPPVVFGIVNDFLLVAVGEDEMKNLLSRASTPQPAWLKALRARYDIPRVATVSYANLGGVMKLVAPLAPPQVSSLIQQIGLANLDKLVSVTGLDEKGFVSYSAIDFDGPLEGLMASAVGQALTAGDLATIPRDPYVGVVARFNLATLYDGVVEFASGIHPMAGAQINQGVQQVEAALGMRLREDLLAALGDVWSLYAAPEDGGLLSGWTATVSIKDAETVRRAIERVRQIAAQQTGRRMPQIVTTRFDGQDIHYVMVPDDDVPVAPSWCVTDKHLVIGLFPQAIKSFLRRQKQAGAESLAAAPQVAAAVSQGGATAVAYVDHKRFVELFYPMVQYGARMGLAEAARQGVEIDFGLVPSPTAITRHLTPGVSVSRKTERGLETEQRQTLPGGSVGATMPVMVALLLPAVQAAREAARRTQSANNIKQIMLSMHNFHDTYRGLPASYNVDADGKPLLSWRVHILPFIGENRLYEQFHLDEPWDSDHNKKLIPQMPMVYRCPNSRAPGGQTTYLGLVSEKSVLQPQKKGERAPVGVRFAEVTDGTSNTLAVVGVNDRRAVPWSKPADHEYSTDAPLAGLLGMFRGGFQAGMCDGSVHFIAETVDVDTLLGLMTRDGGERVDFIP